MRLRSLMRFEVGDISPELKGLKGQSCGPQPVKMASMNYSSAEKGTLQTTQS